MTATRSTSSPSSTSPAIPESCSLSGPIEHFFTIYKELEGKRTEMRGWRGPSQAHDLIRASRRRYREAHPA